MSLRYGRHSAGRVQPASGDEERSYPADGDGTDAATDSQYTTENQATPTPRPTFTPASGDPAAGTVPGPALAPDDALAEDDTVADDGSFAGAEADPVPADEAAALGLPVSATAGRDEPTQVQSVPATVSPAASPDEPLLSDATGLRERWQQVQAEFVDDPREAVGDAAALIEQTTQALVGALRQRQRDLRAGWERGDAGGTTATTANGTTDTERLRLMMQRYRALLNQLCRP
jgi:hypothetical protein